MKLKITLIKQKYCGGHYGQIIVDKSVINPLRSLLFTVYYVQCVYMSQNQYRMDMVKYEKNLKKAQVLKQKSL